MAYHVTRDGQTYGPYTLEDLQRYVTSGNVLLSDMACAEGSAEWLPVAQVLGASSGPSGAVQASASPYPPPANPYGTPVPAHGVPAVPYPDPPNLHWALVLVLIICTCGLFGVIWDLVQVLWVRRVQPATKALGYFIAYIVVSFIGGCVSFSMAAAAMRQAQPHNYLTTVISFVGLVLVILYRFAMKNSLEQHFNINDPVGLRLGPVMTFFFGGLYFQYHFNRINEIKQVARYRGF